MDYILLEGVMPQWLWILFSVLCVLLGLGCLFAAGHFFLKSVFDDFNNRRKLIGTAFLLAIVGIGAVAIFVASDQRQKNSYNASVSAENLKKKYSLDSVEWFATETTARPDHEEAYGNLMVVDHQDQRIVFKYHVNRATGEPFLSNMPVQGGSELSGVTSESIEKH